MGRTIPRWQAPIARPHAVRQQRPSTQKGVQRDPEQVTPHALSAIRSHPHGISKPTKNLLRGQPVRTPDARWSAPPCPLHPPLVREASTPDAWLRPPHNEGTRTVPLITRLGRCLTGRRQLPLYWHDGPWRAWRASATTLDQSLQGPRRARAVRERGSMVEGAAGMHYAHTGRDACWSKRGKRGRGGAYLCTDRDHWLRQLCFTYRTERNELCRIRW
jgi:hypothetical protein